MRTTGSFLALALLTALSAACADPGPAAPPHGAGGLAGGGDGGGGGGGGGGEPIAIPEPAPPAPAAPPVLTPCAAGWHEQEALPGLLACEPYPGETPEPCGPGEAHFAGEPGCARIGSPCPADGWPASAPPDSLFVRAGAAPSGDGSRALPFATIAGALALPPAAGATIAVATGDYLEAVELPGGVTLLGACPEGTRITSPDPLEHNATVNVRGLGAVIRDVGVSGPRVGIRTARDRGVELEGIVVDGAFRWGIVAGDGATTGRSIVVRNTQRTGDERWSAAVHAAAGGRIRLSRVLIDGGGDFGFEATDAGSTLEVRGAAIRRPGAPGGLGMALLARDGALLDASEIAVEDATIAAYAYGAGTALTVSDLRARHLVASALFAFDAATLRGTRLHATDLGVTAIYSTREGTLVSATDAIVTDLRGAADGTGGTGAAAAGPASLELTRVRIARARYSGVAVGEGAHLVASDLAVEDVESLPDGRYGHGVQLRSGAVAGISRLEVRRVRHLGVVASSAVQLTLSDARIDGVRRDASGVGGFGLLAEGGATVAVSRLDVSNVVDAGAWARHPGTTLDLESFSLHDVEGSEDGIAGTGLLGWDAASIQGRIGLVERTRGLGVAALNGSVLDLEEVVVRDVGGICESGSCEGYSSGVAAADDGALGLRRFEVRHAGICGVHVARRGQVDLADGIVADNVTGVVVEPPGYDLDRLEQRVSYVGNVQDLGAYELPLPEVDGEVPGAPP